MQITVMTLTQIIMQISNDGINTDNYAHNSDDINKDNYANNSDDINTVMTCNHR